MKWIILVLLIDKSTDCAHPKVPGSLNRKWLAGLLVYFSPQGLKQCSKAVTWTNCGVNWSQTYNLWNCRHGNKMKYWITEAFILETELLTGFSVNAFFHALPSWETPVSHPQSRSLGEWESSILMRKKPGLWRWPGWLTVSLSHCPCCDPSQVTYPL